MSKTKWIIGIGSGFLLGSKAGPGPYQQVATWTRQISAHPKTRELVVGARQAAGERLSPMADPVKAKVMGTAARLSPARTDPPPEATVHPDPQDLQFGTAAARKEELVDRLLEGGADPEKLPEAEVALAEPADGVGLRPGNKAERSTS